MKTQLRIQTIKMKWFGCILGSIIRVGTPTVLNTFGDDWGVHTQDPAKWDTTDEM